MRKGFDMAARQHRYHSAHIEERTERAKRQFGETYFRSPSERTFSYKGVVIKRHANKTYTINKLVAISGTNPAALAGIWTDGNSLKGAIDYMLESASPERLAEVREQHQNWICPHCKNFSLLSSCKVDITEGGHEEVFCACCHQTTFSFEIVPATDEVMVA